MEALIFLLIAYLFAALVVFPIVALVKLGNRKQEIEALRQQVAALRDELKAAKIQPAAARPVEPLPAAPAPVLPARVEPPPAVVAAPVVVPSVVVPPPPAPVVTSPVIPEPPPLVEPPPPEIAAPPPVEYIPPQPRPKINWEQFMGAKMFAWLGGLALFLGVAFFVKYSFDHGWIPDEVRVTLGFIFGAGLIVAGLFLPRERYRVTGQTLIATGVVSLYAVTFVCGKDHYNFLGPIAMFLVMSLITAAAFVLAVRLGAPVVAILGMLGGFLTPKLLSTGVDNPGGLFGYLALLDVGLVAVVLATGWRYLIPLSGGGTVIMMIGWADLFFTAEKGPVAMIVCLSFAALYVGANDFAIRRGQTSREFSWTAAGMAVVGYLFAFHFLDYAPLAARGPLFFGFVLLIDIIMLVQTWRDSSMPKLHPVSGGIAFILLALWTSSHLTEELLPWTLATYLAFGALHTVFPLLLQRQRPDEVQSWWSQFFPPLALVLMLLPLMKLETTSLLLWPAVLLIDLLAIGVAVLSASLGVIAAVLVLTLIATGACIFKVPAELAFGSSLLVVIGAFAVFFFAASVWVLRRLGARVSEGENSALGGVLGDTRAQLPAFSTLLPFVLLIMVCLRLKVSDPTNVFGLGLLLVILALGLARITVTAWLPACALAGMAALEYAWHTGHFRAEHPGGPLGWYLGFYALFAIYPFVFRSHFRALTGPWAVAALSGVAHFYLVYQAVKLSWPSDVLGAIPALFAVAPLLSLVAVLRGPTEDESARLNQLAWFGGVALFFITLVFPIQFERQWLTVAWALEGAALLWLFHRVPHPGLRLTGVVLLVVAFARLALNSSVLSYHVRSDTAVFNWYLYAYGIATAALFTGARLLAPPRERVFGSNAPALLNTLGVILAFILLNLEIADYFTPPGSVSLALQFSGDFARDMSYTIAWAIFALGLLVAGIWKQASAARYAAIVLLSVALLKLFVHDLTRLGQLYRIGAFFAVAVVAILASVAYQRFLPSNEKTPPPS